MGFDTVGVSLFCGFAAARLAAGLPPRASSSAMPGTGGRGGGSRPRGSSIADAADAGAGAGTWAGAGGRRASGSARGSKVLDAWLWPWLAVGLKGPSQAKEALERTPTAPAIPRVPRGSSSPRRSMPSHTSVSSICVCNSAVIAQRCEGPGQKVCTKVPADR